MLRCHQCKYQEIPPEPVYPPLVTNMADPPPNALRDAMTFISRTLHAQSAYHATPEGQGLSCYQCGHIFDLDDMRWEGNSYELTWGGYRRAEPRRIQTIREEMYTRADNDSQAAIEYLAQRNIPDFAWKGFA